MPVQLTPVRGFDVAMRAYLDMPVHLALKSTNPFVRSLAIIDRRVGRRTLDRLEIGSDEHSLVREFYRLRMQALTGILNEELSTSRTSQQPES